MPFAILSGYLFLGILLGILAKVGREDTANSAVAFVYVPTNEKYLVV